MTEWIYEMFPLLYPLCQGLWLYTGLWQTVYMDYRMGIFGDKSGFIKTDYEPTKSSLDQPIVTGLTKYIVNHSWIRLADERIYYWIKIRVYWSHHVKTGISIMVYQETVKSYIFPDNFDQKSTVKYKIVAWLNMNTAISDISAPE